MIKNRISEICKVYGSRIADGEEFYMSCGTRVGADEVEYEDDESECDRCCPACGEEVDEESVFCTACGQKLEDIEDEHSAEEEYEDMEEPVRICPTCGTEAQDDDIFCMNCGTKL